MGIKPGFGSFKRGPCGWPAPYNEISLYGHYPGWDSSSIRLEDVRKIHFHRSRFMPVDVYMGMLRDDNGGVLGDDSFLHVMNDPLPPRSKRSKHGKSGFCCRPGDVVNMANRVSAADVLFMPVDVYMGLLSTLKLWSVDPSMRMDRCPTLHPLASMVCKSLLHHTTSNRSKEGFHGTLI